MRKFVKGILTVFGVGSILAGATPAMAWVNSPRCGFDQLVHNDYADGRTNWARNAKIQTGNTFYLSHAANLEIINNPTFHLYPIYSTMAGSPWIGPGPDGYLTGQGPAGYPAGANGRVPYSPTPAVVKSAIEAVSSAYKHAQVYNEWVCQPGCYTPTQEVRFSTGNVAIAKAVEGGVVDVMTLAPEATFDALSFMKNEVASFTFDFQDADQDILIFDTAAGGHIEVTTQHPLVAEDGSVRRAADFREGDNLVREDGAMDAITSITSKRFYGKVYNLRPVTTDLISNVLVAQGFLNGSGRYQLEFVKELNRVILRENIPSDVIPLAEDMATDVAK